MDPGNSAACPESVSKTLSAWLLTQDSVVRGFRPESTAAGAGGENGCPKVAVGFESAADMASAEADGHCSAVNALAVCGGCVCSAGSDAMIRCWRAGSLQAVRCARTAGNPVPARRLLPLDLR